MACLKLIDQRHLEVKLFRTIFGRYGTVARPDDVADLQTVAAAPRMPRTDLPCWISTHFLNSTIALRFWELSVGRLSESGDKVRISQYKAVKI